MDGLNRNPSAWFEHAIPGLLTNRTIRSFLTSYKEDSWPELVKLTLLYGVLTLQQQFGDQGLSLERIREEVRQGAVAKSLQDSVPAIAHQVESLRESLGEVLGELSTSQNIEFQPKREAPLCLPPPEPSFLEYPEVENGSNRCLERRAGLPTARENDKLEEIYPSWWGDGSSESQDVKESTKQQGTKRVAAGIGNPAPRLAYSIPPEGFDHVDQDDSLSVQDNRVKNELDELLDSIGVSRLGTANTEETPSRPARIQTTPATQACTSPTKVQDLYLAVKNSTEPPKLWKSQRSAMEIADSILSNPWTSRFMASPDSKSHLNDMDLSKISLGQPLDTACPADNNNNSSNKSWTPPDRRVGVGTLSVARSVHQGDGDTFAGKLECYSGDSVDQGQEENVNLNDEGGAPQEFLLDGSNTLNRQTREHGMSGTGPPASKQGDARKAEAWVMDFGHLGAPRKEKRNNPKKADKDKRDFMRLAKIYEMEKNFSSSTSTTSF